MSKIIRLEAEALKELQTAIVNGALAQPNEVLMAQLNSTQVGSYAESVVQGRMDLLTKAAFMILAGAQCEERYLTPWHVMTDDDWTRAANHIEAEANKELSKAPGHFKGHYNEALLHIAKAYYHADSSNQLLMRAQFGYLFWLHHNVVLLEGRAS